MQYVHFVRQLLSLFQFPTKLKMVLVMCVILFIFYCLNSDNTSLNNTNIDLTQNEYSDQLESAYETVFQWTSSKESDVIFFN